MADRQEELVHALEDLTAAMKRQKTFTESLGQVLKSSMMSSEGLKTAMLKTGRFTEGKMLTAIERMADMPGRIDKTVQAFGQYLEQGIGSHTKEFTGIVSKISALGLDNSPFLQLARSMNAKMGTSIEQRDEQFKELLNLREVTGQNPELMAKALANQSQTFQEAAGLWGPNFAKQLFKAVTVLARENGGDAMIPGLMELIKPFIQPGPEGAAKRGFLGQGNILEPSENMTQMETNQMLLDIIRSVGTNPAFGSALNKDVTGRAIGLGGKEFQVAQEMESRLKGVTAQSLMSDLVRLSADGEIGDGSQSVDQLMSTKMNNLTNQSADILTESILILSAAFDGLAGQAATLADWLAGILKGFAIGGATKVAGSVDLLGTTGALAGAVGSLAKETGKGLYKFFTAGNGLERIFDSVVLFFQEWSHKIPRLLNDAILNLGNTLHYTFDWVKDFLTLFGKNLIFDLKTIQMKVSNDFQLAMDLLGLTVKEAMDFGLDDEDYDDVRAKMKADSHAGTGEYMAADSNSGVRNREKQMRERAGIREFSLPEMVASDVSEKEEDIGMAREQVRLLAYFKAAFDGDTMKGDLSELKTSMSSIWKWLDEKATAAL